MRVSENRPLLWGIGMLTLGGVITVGSYAAADGGGTYVVTTGLLLVGAYNLLRGLYYQIKYGSVSKY